LSYASAVDDPHRKPGDSDRDHLVARIKRAAEQGRFGITDRDIRLANVASAQSMTELDLMNRDLDQLEAALPAGTLTATAAAAPATTSAPAPPWAGSVATAGGEELADAAVSMAKSTARSVGIVTVLIILLVLAGAGASAYFAFRSSDDAGSGELFEPQPVPTAGSDDPASDPSASDPSSSGTKYSLTARGIRAFVAEYKAKFDTTLVVGLTMYGDYAVVQVPQAGKKRHAGFLYRQGAGWTDFGGVTANFPGSAVIDLRRLDVSALVHNIARARRTLNVEDASQTYVNIDYRPQSDDAPNVNIYVSNKFNESGYLATRLDGTVERAYAFAN
jgi:hypothetical protein